MRHSSEITGLPQLLRSQIGAEPSRELPSHLRAPGPSSWSDIISKHNETADDAFPGYVRSELVNGETKPAHEAEVMAPAQEADLDTSVSAFLSTLGVEVEPPEVTLSRTIDIYDRYGY